MTEELEGRPFTQMSAEVGGYFMGLPDRWYEDATWKCANGHIAKVYLKSEDAGCGVCLTCGAVVLLTFPEDRMVFECWEAEDGSAISLGMEGQGARFAELEEEDDSPSHFRYAIRAATWSEAMRAHHEIQGWEAYKDD